MPTAFLRLNAVATLVSICIVAPLLASAQPATIHPSFARVPEKLADPGELLISDLNCVACHQAEAAVKARLASKQGPALDAQGLHLTSKYLRRFLTDPQGAKPGNTMPDLLHGMETAERAADVDALVHFLASSLNSSAAVPVAADEFKIQQGRLLYHQVGCVACHGAQEPVSAIRASSSPPNEEKEKPLQSPAPFGDLARKTTVESLTRFLKDPLKNRPSGRMPSLNLTDVEATAISMYLLRSQASAPTPNGPRAKSQGLSFQYFEGTFKDTSDLEKQKPKSSGLIDHFDVGGRKTKQNFGLRLSGFVVIPRDGSYTFYTDSDDGSRLYIDGKPVVENDGIHGPTEVKASADLKAGDHPILVSYFNGGSGASLKVSFAGPGISKREIPASALYTYDGQPMLPLDREEFAIDSEKANRGKQLFGSLGCAACHTATGIDSNQGSKTKALATLSTDSGCLAQNPPKTAPKYAFSADQREAIRRTLLRRDDLAKPLDAGAQVNHTMAALNCFACHSRDGIGGRSPERAEYFTTVGDVDLGDEGRLPPHLTRVGDKLVPDWAREILMNRGTSRPYMATRMPQFGANNVGHMAGAFKLADRSATQESAEDTSGLDAKFGRNLVGIGGMACISCHTFGPHKSLGIPAMDLTLMTKRLKRDWFRRYLLDPQSLRPGTRMPTFWPDGKSSRQDILSGNTDRQINAIWAFLSRGKEGGLPPGLVQGKMELVATTEPIIYRHFLEGAGSRAIGVGYPEKANLAFDGNDLRLALIWQGSFIDAARHRTGRGDGWVPPLGYNTIRMPPGPAFALLDSPNAQWPEKAGRSGGFHLRGYAFDDQRRPDFRYSFEDYQIDDKPVPVMGEVDPFLRREVAIHAEQPAQNLWFRAWVGQKVEEQAGNTYIADGRLKLHFDLPGGARPLVRQSSGHAELLIPVRFNGHEAHFVEEIIW